MKIPTVFIDTPEGPVRINESDYDEEQHTLVEELVPASKTAKKTTRKTTKKPATKASK